MFMCFEKKVCIAETQTHLWKHRNQHVKREIKLLNFRFFCDLKSTHTLACCLPRGHWRNCTVQSSLIVIWFFTVSVWCRSFIWNRVELGRVSPGLTLWTPWQSHSSATGHDVRRKLETREIPPVTSFCPLAAALTSMWLCLPSHRSFVFFSPRICVVWWCNAGSLMGYF